MPAPIKSGGDLSRRVQNQSPQTVAASAVITIGLLNLFSAIFAGILNYAFSHPRRMYEVGAWFVGLPTLAAFVQGCFYVNGPPLISPVAMFVLIGMTVVMKFHESVISELHVNRHEKSVEYRRIYCNGLIAGITATTFYLWGLTAFAIWWSPDTSEIYRWLGLAMPDEVTREQMYDLCVLLIVMILICNSSLHMLLRRQVRCHYEQCRQSLPAEVDVRSAVERLWMMARIERDEKNMFQELRRIRSQHSTPVLLGVTSVFTGIYYLAIGPLRGQSAALFW